MVMVTWPTWPPYPYMVKTLRHLLFSNHWVDWLETWFVASVDWVLSILFKWPCVDLDPFLSRSNLVPWDIEWGKCETLHLSKNNGSLCYESRCPLGFWMEKKWNIIFFQNNGTLWYGRRCFMHLCENQKPRSFSDLGQRSLGLNVLTFSSDFFSETAGPISIKFHIQHPGNGRLKICSNGLGLMPRWPQCPYMVKTLKNLLLQNRSGWLPWNLVCSIRWLSTTKFVQMVTLGWPWPIFHQGQIWFLGLLNGEKVKHCIFPKQWYSVTWKKVLHAPLWIPKAKVISVTLA